MGVFRGRRNALVFGNELIEFFAGGAVGEALGWRRQPADDPELRVERVEADQLYQVVVACLGL